MSELIHNSSNHRNLESARVSVHFTEIIDTVSLHDPPLTKALRKQLCTCKWHAPPLIHWEALTQGLRTVV